MWLVQNMETKKIQQNVRHVPFGKYKTWLVQNVVSTKHVEIKHREYTSVVLKNIQNTNKS